MKIVGIDPALSITGYGLIETARDTFRLLEAGVIKTASHTALPQRLEKIYNATKELIRETRPDVIVLEKLYAHYRHPTTAYILGEARGIVCLAAAEAKIEIKEYAATRVKKAIVGKGLAPKYQIQRMIVQLFGLKKTPAYSDVTDALALAVAHFYISKFNAQRL